MKRPAFQFYPGDWLMDSSLRVVSVGARGAWIDMLCLMHQADPYGHLKVNGKVILPTNLARILGATLAETEGYLAELSEAGVYSTDDIGCIFSRRMIRDEKLRQVRAAGGKLGGNPHLKEESARLGGRLTLEVNQKPTPSSSSSSPSSKEESGEVPSPPPSPKAKTSVFNTWIESIPDGVDAIPQDHHVFAYAKRAGIPGDFLALAWVGFDRRYRDQPKRYTDWPGVFRKAVEGNWLKLWWVDDAGNYKLTTAGQQLARTAEAV